MIRYNICPICYEEIIEEYVTECNHKFCKVCITKWAKIKPLCPYCKTGLLKIIFENDDLIYAYHDILLELTSASRVKLFLNRLNHSLIHFHNESEKLNRMLDSILRVLNEKSLDR